LLIVACGFWKIEKVCDTGTVLIDWYFNDALEAIRCASIIPFPRSATRIHHHIILVGATAIARESPVGIAITPFSGRPSEGSLIRLVGQANPERLSAKLLGEPTRQCLTLVAPREKGEFLWISLANFAEPFGR
jgi:hypothetical protein